MYRGDDINSSIRRLFRDDSLNSTDLIAIMRAARHIHAEDAEGANSILEEAGNYLPRHCIEPFIRAEVSDEDAKSEIKRQKAFFRRLGALLPSLFRYLNFDPQSDVVNALGAVDDCHHDFVIASSARRQDKKRREILGDLHTAILALKDAIGAITKVQSQFELEFDRLYASYVKRIRKIEPLDRNLRVFLEDVTVCLNALQITEGRAQTEDDYLYVQGNQARGDVVEYAHTLCRYWDGPPLVTTPGSDFSNFCSLLYEVVSGVADESLSGAINRYSRSKERKDADLHDMQFRAEEDDTYIPDNFYNAEQIFEYATATYEKYQHVHDYGGLPEGAKLLANLAIAEELERAVAAMEKYGPNLVWAHQLPPDPEFDELVETTEAILRKVGAELGRARRGGAAFNLNQAVRRYSRQQLSKMGE
jgi:hypothetical protein